MQKSNQDQNDGDEHQVKQHFLDIKEFEAHLRSMSFLSNWRN